MRNAHSRVAIVTGADDPVGAACVARLAAEGVHVVAAASQTVVAAAVTHTHDGTSPESWQSLIAAAERFGGPTILVNAEMCFQAKPFAQTSLEDLRALSRANVVPAWLGMKEVIPALRRHGGGYVVNVVSSLGRIAHPDAAVFSALAGGVRIATKSAALEGATREPRVIVNAVLVGNVPARDEAGSSVSMADFRIGPAIDPADVAAAVAQLAGDDSDYVTGMEIYVDGGYAAGAAR
ncbi:MAG: SDR family oxidoreductase [Alphaproteobacteria bacterium]